MAGKGSSSKRRILGKSLDEKYEEESERSFALGNPAILAGVPPLPPRSNGITELEGNPKDVYAAQSVTGKILCPKDLCVS